MYPGSPIPAPTSDGQLVGEQTPAGTHAMMLTPIMMAGPEDDAFP